MLINSTSPPLQALSNLALLPKLDLKGIIIYYKSAIRKIDGHEDQASLAPDLALHQASLLIGDSMSRPGVALADEGGPLTGSRIKE